MMSLVVRKWIFIAALAVGAPALAAEVTVTSESAELKDSPADGGRTLGRMARGRRLVATGEERGGYLKLKTKNNREVWIAKRDTDSVESDLVDGGADEGGGSSGFPKF